MNNIELPVWALSQSAKVPHSHTQCPAEAYATQCTVTICCTIRSLLGNAAAPLEQLALMSVWASVQ